MTFATFHVTLPVPRFRKVRSDRDRLRGGEADFPLLLDHSLPHNLTSTGRPSGRTTELPTMPLTLPLDAGAKDASVRRALLNLSLAVTKSKRIVVVTGAGISCSCGIPVGQPPPRLHVFSC